jgi:hypothetical protein
MQRAARRLLTRVCFVDVLFLLGLGVAGRALGVLVGKVEADAPYPQRLWCGARRADPC